MPRNAARPGWNRGVAHSARATAALRALTEADPALAALSLWCTHRDADGPTVTRGTVIRYGPGFATLPLHEQIGLAGHHILHASLQHSARMAAMEARFGDGFAPDLWRMAADAIINEALLQAGHALPRPALTLTGLLRAVTGATPPAVQALAEWDVDRLYLKLTGDGTAAGQAREHARGQGFADDLEAEDETEAAEGEQTRADWRGHLARAMAAGQAAGIGLGVFGHRLADLPVPRTPWEVVLRRLLARATLPRPAPSHRRPARSWLALDAQARADGTPAPVFQPGLARTQAAPRLVLALDCSASIDAARLSLLAAELGGIARRCAASLHLLAFDTAVRIETRLDPARVAGQLRALDLPQGGGTDFAPVIARAVALRASALVVLTDLDGPTGPPPRLPVIWAVPRASAPPDTGFGLVLHLSH